MRKFAILLTIVYLFHLAFFSTFLLYPTLNLFLILDIFPFIFLTFYEILVMASDFNYYLKQNSNLLDVILYVINGFTLYLNFIRDDFDNIYLIYLKLFALIISFSKGFLVLQVFDSFRHLINMIISITKSITTTIILFFYFVIGFAFLLTQSKRKYRLLDLIKTSFLSVFGNLIEENEEDPFDLSVWLIIAAVGIMITLILSNFLIAIMSSKYAELELKQQAISLQGQADMIQELEIVMKLFKKEEISSNRKWFLSLLLPTDDSKDKKLKKLFKRKKKYRDKKELKKEILFIGDSSNKMKDKMVGIENKMMSLENKIDGMNIEMIQLKEILKDICINLQKNK